MRSVYNDLYFRKDHISDDPLSTVEPHSYEDATAMRLWTTLRNREMNVLS